MCFSYRNIFIVFLMAALWCSHFAFADEQPQKADDSAKSKSTKLMMLTGDLDFGDQRTAWDKTYERKDYLFGKDPSPFLVNNINKIPLGQALDIATGEGRNAVFLAKKGFSVEGVDISAVGLRKAEKLAAENGVRIRTINADLNKYKIKPDRYTVILNFFYLQRNLFSQIKAGLKKGGVLIFQTHTVDQLKNVGGSSWEKEYLLEKGELKKAFSDMEIIYYAETNNGKLALASLIAKKK